MLIMVAAGDTSSKSSLYRELMSQVVITPASSSDTLNSASAVYVAAIEAAFRQFTENKTAIAAGCMLQTEYDMMAVVVSEEVPNRFKQSISIDRLIANLILLLSQTYSSNSSAWKPTLACTVDAAGE